jgi:hypothetical protein
LAALSTAGPDAMADASQCKAVLLVHSLSLIVVVNVPFGVSASPSDALSVPFCPSSILKSSILTTFVLRQRLTEALGDDVLGS